MRSFIESPHTVKLYQTFEIPDMYGCLRYNRDYPRDPHWESIIASVRNLTGLAHPATASLSKGTKPNGMTSDFQLAVPHENSSNATEGFQS